MQKEGNQNIPARLKRMYYIVTTQCIFPHQQHKEGTQVCQYEEHWKMTPSVEKAHHHHGDKD